MSDSLTAPDAVAIVDSPIPCCHCLQSLQGIPLDGICPHCQAPVAATLAPAFLDLQTGTVNTDVPCPHCDYNLRSLHISKVCPECGTPVAEDLRSDRLEFADPAWRRRILSGVSRFLFAGIGMPIVALFTLIVASLRTGWEREDVYAVGFSIDIGMAVLLIVGVFGITTRERVRPWRDEKAWPAQMARLTATVAFLCGSIGVPSLLMPGRLADLLGTATAPAILLAIIATLAIAMCLRHTTRRSGLTALAAGTQTWQQCAAITAGIGLISFLIIIFGATRANTVAGLAAIILACTCIIGAVLWIMALPGLFLLRRTLLRIQTQQPSQAGK